MTGNGTAPELPEDRKAAVEYGLTQFNVVAAERDALRDEVRQLRSDLAAHKVMVEAQQTQIADIESRVASAYAVRDEAVAKHSELRGLFIGFRAQMSAFEIESGPLVRERVPPDDDDNSRIAGA